MKESSEKLKAELAAAIEAANIPHETMIELCSDPWRALRIGAAIGYGVGVEQTLAEQDRINKELSGNFETEFPVVSADSTTTVEIAL